jgi:hypothetical protein
MTSFTDREDRHLVQLAVKYEDRHERVCWDAIVRAMKYSKKERVLLQRRLSALKQTHGRKLSDFPAWFFVAPRANERSKLHLTRGWNMSIKLLLPMPAAPIINRTLYLCSSLTSNVVTSKSAMAPSACTTTQTMQVLSSESKPADPDFYVAGSPIPEPTTLASSTNSAITDTPNASTANPATPGCGTVAHIDQSTQPLLTPVPINGCLLEAFEQAIAETTENEFDDTQLAIDEIFRTVTKSDVNQSGARQHENVGELTVTGVTMLVNECTLTEKDVFVDVGSGIGNVITQVALKTAVHKCIGVEIRVDTALLSRRLIEAHAYKYPNIRKVHIYPEDICKVDITTNMWQQATVLYSHNTLFDGLTLVGLEALCCKLRSLRIVILQEPFCHRHRPRCTREFCLLFVRRCQSVEAPVSYHASNRSFVIYDRVVVQQDTR